MNSALLRSAVLPVWYGLKGNSTLTILPELCRTQWLSSEQLYDLQWEKLSGLIRHAYENVPYYRGAMQAAGVTPEDVIQARSLESLPPMDRRTLASRRADLLAANVPVARHRQNATGGSTGEPLRFVDDTGGDGVLDAAVHRTQTWAGVDVGARAVYLWGSNFDLSRWQGFFGRVRSRVVNTLMLSAWQLSRERARDYLRQTVRYKPEFIVAYAGAMQRWCLLLNEKPRMPSLKAVIVSAEVLEPAWRTIIENTFGAPVFNRYGGRDIKCVAQECDRHDGLHINAETVYVEILRDGKPAPAGNQGEIVVTRLDNMAMPFIRYRTGDIGSMVTRVCPCGRGLPLLASVDGRTLDTILMPSGNYVSGAFFAHLLKDFPEVQTYQVHQTAADMLDIWLVTNPPGSLASRERLSRILSSHLGPGLKFQFTLRERSRYCPTGKGARSSPIFPLKQPGV